VIRLTLCGKDGETAALEITDLRVAGGVLWNHLDYGLIANYCDGRWKHRGEYYSRISVAGGCCLLFGIARDPTLLSDPLELFSFSGQTFHAAGIAVARYIEQQDMWQGLVRPIWWTSMRIVEAATVSALAEPGTIELLNPWEPIQGEAAESIPARERVALEQGRDVPAGK
jgi:hypothetical protein